MDSKDITHRELARLSGIKKSTIGNIKNGKKSPTMNEMERLAKALNVKITDLFESFYK